MVAMSRGTGSTEGGSYALSPWSSQLPWSSQFPWSARDAPWSSWSPTARRRADVICAKPFRRGVAEYGCGKCEPCRVDRRRLWTTRLLLEAQQHSEACFVTLTYDEKHLPADGSVQVRDLQLFLKRLRRLCVRKLRYFAVGEYGDHTKRPHYHAIVFGCSDPDLVARAWPLGFVHVGLVSEASILYTCKYAVKGMTSGKDERLAGRKPEFARMSLRPGIGAHAVGEMARVTTSRAGARHVAATGDVPRVIRIAGKRPIGRYLSAKLREAVGMDSRRPLAAEDLWNRERQAALLQPGGAAAREVKREQTRLSAVARHKLSLLKKGVGL